jgi:hypothetical protein
VAVLDEDRSVGGQRRVAGGLLGQDLRALLRQSHTEAAVHVQPDYDDAQHDAIHGKGGKAVAFHVFQKGRHDQQGDHE